MFFQHERKYIAFKIMNSFTVPGTRRTTIQCMAPWSYLSGSLLLVLVEMAFSVSLAALILSLLNWSVKKIWPYHSIPLTISSSHVQYPKTNNIMKYYSTLRKLEVLRIKVMGRPTRQLVTHLLTVNKASFSPLQFHINLSLIHHLILKVSSIAAIPTQC